MEPAIKLPPDRYETRVTPLWTFANHPNKQSVYDKHRILGGLAIALILGPIMAVIIIMLYRAWFS